MLNTSKSWKYQIKLYIVPWVFDCTLSLRMLVNLSNRIYSLTTVDVIWCHKTLSTLVWVMARCLMAKNHHPNQCGISIREIVWHLKFGEGQASVRIITHYICRDNLTTWWPLTLRLCVHPPCTSTLVGWAPNRWTAITQEMWGGNFQGKYCNSEEDNIYSSASDNVI